MTDILFITSTHNETMKNEVNGTMLLATKLLQAGYAVDILRFYQIQNFNKSYTNFITEITEKILDINPRCVSFYTLWPYYHVVIRIVSEIKKKRPGIVTVLGGPQSSATALATMKAVESVDYICTGEGENTVVPFFDCILNERYKSLSEIPGLYYRHNGMISFNDSLVPTSDLNSLPYWDERLLLPQKEMGMTADTYFMPIDIGRGCPFSCTFCSSSRFWKRRYRLKSAERIIEDINYYKTKFGINSFSFSHDAFTVNSNLVLKICDKMISAEMGIKWKCTTRVDCVSEELLLKMIEAGMTHIELGIETGSVRMQKIINKKLDLNKVKNTVSFLLKQGVHVDLFFMYGFPEETEEDLNDTLSLLFDLVDMGAQYTNVSFCRFNPNTPITEAYLDQLVLDPEIKVLSRAIFGYEEEKQIIQDNKPIFPFFYHLNTPVRDEYQYLILFTNWYERFPGANSYLRKLYNGDNLQLYKDFYNENRICFESTIDNAVEYIKERSWEMALNVLKKHNASYIEQLKAVLKFSYDLKWVSSYKGDATHREIYNFNYLDFKRKKPIEHFLRCKTEILIQKANGKMSMRILSIQ